MRSLASIQTIVDIRPIKDADSIVVAQVLGWECVVKKDEFNIGDTIVYIEIDSIVPEIPQFEFLKDRKFRVRTIKLRGQVSQGLVVGMDVLPKGKYHVGQDVTDILGVRKYDPQAEQEAKMAQEELNRSKRKIDKFFKRYAWYRRIFMSRKSKASFPKFIKKTDEDRIQLFPDICEREKGIPFGVTEKIDGCSVTYFVVKNPHRFLCFGEKYVFGVCSRNIHLRKEDNSHYWKVARQLHIKEVLMDLTTSMCAPPDVIVLQGEIIGEGIQANKYGVSGHDFYAFNMSVDGDPLITDHIRCILPDEIKVVPVLYKEEEFMLKDSISEMVEFAKGKSAIANIPREGIVVRNYDKRISFKVINPDFLLKYNE